MKTVSEETINSIQKRMEGMIPEDVTKLVERMGEEQPIILAYLLANGEEMTEDEQGFLIFLGINVWQMMSEGSQPPAKISEEILEETEDKNIKMVEYYGEESDAEQWDLAERLVNDYNQHKVLEYVLESIMEEPEEESVIQEDNIGIFMLCLKTVTDCFDR